ncbi:hypothetical protein [Desulfosporosinus sp. SB140]|uniref:hypothetical protein n=1 Tax=Desulfosporosinus paludis TaxID=3115649 RepID=UPI00388EC7E4
MKEHTIWLSPEELQQMLQGSLHWMDVAPRVTTSRIGMRKLAEWTSPPRLELEGIALLEPKQAKKRNETKHLEGQPVVWLLGSIGLLTLSSWFYFVLFSK